MTVYPTEMLRIPSFVLAMVLVGGATLKCYRCGNVYDDPDVFKNHVKFKCRSRNATLRFNDGIPSSSGQGDR